MTMTPYLVLIFGGKRPANEAEFAAIVESWSTWGDELGETMVDLGNPFSHAKTITADSVQDGVEGEQASGYCIIRAANMAEAVKLTQGSPSVAQGGRVEIYEVFKVL
jgi:hypothetical protein